MALNTNLTRQLFLTAGIRAFLRNITPLNAFSNGIRSTAGEIMLPWYPLTSTSSTEFVKTTGYVSEEGNAEGVLIEVNKRRYKDLTYSSADVNRLVYDPSVIGEERGNLLVSDVMTDILSVITADNFANETVCTASNFDVDALIVLGTMCDDADFPKEGRYLLLNSTYYGNLKKDIKASGGVSVLGVSPFGTVATLEGFNIVSTKSLPSNVNGCIVNRNAILTGFAPIKAMPELNVGYTAMSDPKSGLTLEARTRIDQKLDQVSHTIECNYGYKVGNPDALIRIVATATATQ